MIIGNSTAAIGCIEAIRRIDNTGMITVISSEPYKTYSRPLISYFLSGRTDEERMKYRGDDFYKDMRCNFMPGKTVTAINPQGHNITLRDGSVLAYDKLLVATGSIPFIPPIPGLDEVKDKYTLMTLDDSYAIKSALNKQKNMRVLILGAGLIGLKCAEGITDKAGSVTVIDQADHILPSILSREAAALVQSHIQKHGIRFILGDSVKQFTAYHAVLASGASIEFDMLIVAAGVLPNISLLAEAGGKIGRAIITDKHQKTSLPDIYAAGDCTESIDAVSGQSRVLAILPNAYQQGECAGTSMAGVEAAFKKPIAMNAVSFFGLHLLSAGNYDGESHEIKGRDSYKLLVSKDNHLNGYIIIGDVANAGIYTSIIKNRIPLDCLDFTLIKDKPQLMAFSPKERKAMLGGADI